MKKIKQEHVNAVAYAAGFLGISSEEYSGDQKKRIKKVSITLDELSEIMCDILNDDKIDGKLHKRPQV